MRSLSILVLLMLAGVTIAPAQRAVSAAHRQGRVPVVVALLTQLPHGSAPFEILRRPKGPAHDIIVLPATASTSDLSAAVQTLMLARSRAGDTATTAAIIRVHGSSRAPGSPLPWAGRVLADVRAAAPRTVDGLGAAQAVTVWLPAHRRGPVR